MIDSLETARRSTPPPSTAPGAAPADDEPPYPLPPACKDQRHDRAHRVADEIDLRRFDLLEQDPEVARHALLAVAGGVVWLLGGAVPPGVGGNDPATAREQRVHDARGDPVGLRVGDEAVVQHHRW